MWNEYSHISSSQNAPNGSFFLLHACAHNPTGVDPSEEQWREISHQFKVNTFLPFYSWFSSPVPLPPSFFDIKHHVIFRLKVILPSLIWLIKVSLVVIQTEMQSPSGFFSRTVIILVFPNHMQKIWDSMARE